MAHNESKALKVTPFEVITKDGLFRIHASTKEQLGPAESARSQFISLTFEPTKQAKEVLGKALGDKAAAMQLARASNKLAASLEQLLHEQFGAYGHSERMDAYHDLVLWNEKQQQPLAKLKSVISHPIEAMLDRPLGVHGGFETWLDEATTYEFATLSSMDKATMTVWLKGEIQGGEVIRSPMPNSPIKELMSLDCPIKNRTDLHLRHPDFLDEVKAAVTEFAEMQTLKEPKAPTRKAEPKAVKPMAPVEKITLQPTRFKTNEFFTETLEEERMVEALGRYSADQKRR